MGWGRRQPGASGAGAAPVLTGSSALLCSGAERMRMRWSRPGEPMRRPAGARSSSSSNGRSSSSSSSRLLPWPPPQPPRPRAPSPSPCWTNKGSWPESGSRSEGAGKL